MGAGRYADAGGARSQRRRQIQTQLRARAYRLALHGAPGGRSERPHGFSALARSVVEAADVEHPITYGPVMTRKHNPSLDVERRQLMRRMAGAAAMALGA